MGICDLHCHLLPEIDDGSVSRENFERMLQLYRESGVGSIAFTPHVYNPYVTTNISMLRGTYEWAASIASSMGLVTYLGSELFVGTQKVLKSVPIKNTYSLVEFGINLPPANLFERLEALAGTGLTVIVAHIERYRWLSVESPLLARFKDLGALVQVNVEAVESGLALPYLHAGLVDIIATDNHGEESLPGRLLSVLGNWPEVYQKMERMGL
ncbi:capsular polysaccharide biosynthesis protein [Sphaerochaeta pleomorpha str. Grapes]|uniref:protein-tyrosine-phosphatase n=1 Tax=Sphaerochaeta pleomorpha (strain ATCC BAA-1885 / DSM 22778 / Grapes) TaxID=158190 RepID=G8QXV3_SPHPG|nr:CpsB/CapC family capsule biosynthesis tyrosine phosphatase [Sphaerochaeta pleomorpha]AEV30747.1 capsular polysaccharide biosynthesis protein [Sphaerochaeta pleomorpha str. Grapes]